jgi:hypothetical protein
MNQWFHALGLGFQYLTLVQKPGHKGRTQGLRIYESTTKK